MLNNIISVVKFDTISMTQDTLITVMFKKTAIKTLTVFNSIAFKTQVTIRIGRSGTRIHR
jgi:hypothetical protein